MGLKIYWTKFATNELRKVFLYYRETANAKIAQNLVEAIVRKTKKLVYQPEIGQKEILLSGYKDNIRYLVHKNYKIIYRINAKHQRIEILDVFDTRQNPEDIGRGEKYTN